MAPSRTFLSVVGAVCLMLAAGCSERPTYPKARITESLKQILDEDHLQASVHFVDHTLGVQLHFPGVLTQTESRIGIGPNFDEAARRVLTAIHRVLLSSDAEIDFYVLLLSDPQTPGAYLTVVRYMDDIRKANANMLDTPEMFARTIYELNYVGSTPITIEQYVPRDIHLEEFLSWQLARRIQSTLAADLDESGAAHVGRCGGRFQDGEFVFTLDVTPISEGPMEEATLRKVFQESTNVVAKVLSSYKFEKFSSVRLVHPLTGQQVVKTNLELFR